MYNLSYEAVSEKPRLRDILSTKRPDSSKLLRLWATKELYQFGKDYRCETKCNKETGLDPGPKKNIHGTAADIWIIPLD